MRPSSYVPHVTIAASLPARYRYWMGISGARYLFTLIDSRSLGDFEGAVALVARGRHILWVGQAAELVRYDESGAHEQGAALYVHLLAASAKDRRAVIADLRPDQSDGAVALAA